MPTNWEADTTQRVGRQLRKSRKELKLSAQGLADRTSELGHPIGRATITDLETGRRQSVTVAELLILAAALDISPIALLYADQLADGIIEALPGKTTTAAMAALQANGERPHHRPEDVGRAQDALDLVRRRDDAESSISTVLRFFPPDRQAEQLQLHEDRRRLIEESMRELGLIVADRSHVDSGGSDAGID